VLYVYDLVLLSFSLINFEAQFTLESEKVSAYIMKYSSERNILECWR
jgi:hypothetical protein